MNIRLIFIAEDGNDDSMTFHQLITDYSTVSWIIGSSVFISVVVMGARLFTFIPYYVFYHFFTSTRQFSHIKSK